MRGCAGAEPTRRGADPALITSAFEKHWREVYAWLDSKPYVECVARPYHDVLRRPKDIAQQLAKILGISLDLEARTKQVDASLYRNRSK